MFVDDFMGQLAFKLVSSATTVAETTSTSPHYISSSVIPMTPNQIRNEWLPVEYKDEKDRNRHKDKPLGDIDVTIQWRSELHRREVQHLRIEKLIHDSRESDSKNGTALTSLYESWFPSHRLSHSGLELRGKLKVAALDGQPDEWKSDEQDFTVDILDIDEKTACIAGRYHVHGDKVSSSYHTLLARR
jgi:hypothetical protein